MTFIISAMDSICHMILNNVFRKTNFNLWHFNNIFGSPIYQVNNCVAHRSPISNLIHLTFPLQFANEVLNYFYISPNNLGTNPYCKLSGSYQNSIETNAKQIELE